MKKFILIATILIASSFFVACKTVWLNSVTLTDDGSYIVASSCSEGNGELYKATVEGNKLKCKLIVAESRYSK